MIVPKATTSSKCHLSTVIFGLETVQVNSRKKQFILIMNRHVTVYYESSILLLVLTILQHIRYTFICDTTLWFQHLLGFLESIRCV